MSDRGLTLFTDWYSVWPGNIGIDANGLGRPVDLPRGVRLAVQPAVSTAPVLQADRPWESGFLWTSVVRDANTFKMWYMVAAVERDAGGKVVKDTNFDPQAGEFEGAKKQNFICYAESDDGFAWRKPELGMHAFAGSRANNIVLPCVEDGFDSVFRDRDGGWRMLFHAAPLPGGRSIWACMRSRTSRDGLRWTPDEAPVMDMYCDTQNVGFYDELLQEYACYVRFPRGTRRAVGLTRGKEFRHLPHPEIVFEPDPQDGPSLDFYTPAYSRHPHYLEAARRDTFDLMGRTEGIQRQHDARDMHFLFSSVYHRDRDVTDIQLAVSRDGRQWSRPERVPIIPLGPDGCGAGDSLYAVPGIHVLDSGRWGVLYSASDRLHNTGFTNPEILGNAQYRWATWQPNRLVALQAESDGACTVLLNGRAAREMRFNYQTETGGSIRAELIKGDPRTHEGLWPPSGPTPLAGYTFSDCDPLVGDSLAQPVTWKGSSALPADDAASDTVLRLRLIRAKLFAIEWE